MAATWLIEFSKWIELTSISKFLSGTTWIGPNILTLHILGVAAVWVSAMMINLRLLGLTGLDQSTSRVLERFLPVIWWALLIQLVTGAILITAAPVRDLVSLALQVKVLLLLAAILLTLGLQFSIKHETGYWEVSANRRMTGKVLALISSLLWIGIIFAGNLIAG